MDLHGQSDLSPSCFGPRVVFFRTGAVGLQAMGAFVSLFELFEILQLPALLLSLAPRVALFSERAPWAQKQSTRFAVFVISEYSSSSAVLLPLAPVSLIVQLFDAF